MYALEPALLFPIEHGWKEDRLEHEHEQTEGHCDGQREQ